MTILGLDYGEKRIGVAVSDPDEKMAFGMEILHRSDIKKDIARIKEIICLRNARTIVVGLPINMNGTYGEKAKEVEEFCVILKDNLEINIKTWDERLSSVQAERVLTEANLSEIKKRKVLDKMAAQIFLQSYLDKQNADRRR
ncbi:Holliday junction resolvase RuvX [Chlamydiota bacterium]